MLQKLYIDTIDRKIERERERERDEFPRERGEFPREDLASSFGG